MTEVNEVEKYPSTPDQVCREIYEYLAFLDEGGKPVMTLEQIHDWLGHMLYTLKEE